MSFRARLVAGVTVAALVPLVVFALGIRQAVEQQLTAQFQRRVDGLAALIEADLERERARLGSRLAGLIAAAQEDNRLRAAVARASADDRVYLLDYAGAAMRLAGLDLLQIQDETGRILSSGHFRNEYDRRDPAVPRLLLDAPRGAVLMRARGPDGPFLALARADTFRLGGRRLALVGGIGVARDLLARLAPDDELTVALSYPGGALSSRADTVAPGRGVPPGDRVVRALTLPYVDVAGGVERLAEARLVASHPLTALAGLRGEINRWFGVALAAAAALALALGLWLAARVSRPLTALARQTQAIDLDRLDADFASARRDEIGDLTRLLGAMTERLRASAVRLREAERLVAMGELARQVNHDIKNGLVPIRNVLRHLAEVAAAEPARLPAIFNERRGTLESAVAYLETLARHYARLVPAPAGVTCDANAIVREVVRHAPRPAHVELRTDLENETAAVHGDRVALQRVLENLVGNAVDAIGEAGVVTVVTCAVNGDQGRAVRITVADTGGGMSRAEMDRAFDDFYTTKPGGSGLGLSIVRRLVLDLGGSLRVETEQGVGTRFVVELPAGAAEAAGGSG